MTGKNIRLGNILCTAALMLGAYWLGSAAPARDKAMADIVQSGSTEPFLAGDERSIPVLKEIAATVKQIDSRLERIEKTLPAAKQQ
jgi:hypothetical protein